MSQNKNVPDMSDEVEQLTKNELREAKLDDERWSPASSGFPEHKRQRREGVRAQSGRRVFTKDEKLETA